MNCSQVKNIIKIDNGICIVIILPSRLASWVYSFHLPKLQRANPYSHSPPVNLINKLIAVESYSIIFCAKFSNLQPVLPLIWYHFEPQTVVPIWLSLSEAFSQTRLRRNKFLSDWEQCYKFDLDYCLFFLYNFMLRPQLQWSKFVYNSISS